MWHLVRFVCVCLSAWPACLLVMSISRTKTDEPIETPFGFWNSGAEGTLDVDAESPRMEALFGESIISGVTIIFAPPRQTFATGPSDFVK